MSLLLLFAVSMFACSDATKKAEIERVESKAVSVPSSAGVLDPEEQKTIEQGVTAEPKHPLSQFNAEEVEYARVWLQETRNKEVKPLVVRKVAKGEKINPYDETSAVYPSEAIMLSGSHSVDGSVVYSSNGDGTITVYDIPSHWPSPSQVETTMEAYTTNILKEAIRKNLETGETGDVIQIIQQLKKT